MKKEAKKNEKKKMEAIIFSKCLKKV